MGILVFIAILIIAYLLISALVGTAISIIGLILPLIIWGVIGWLAGQLLRGRGYGVLVNIALGLAGGIVGGILFRALGSNWGDGGLVGTIIVGVVGSAVLILAGRLLRGGR